MSRTADDEEHPAFADKPRTLRTEFHLETGEHPVRVDLRDLDGRLPPVYNQGTTDRLVSQVISRGTLDSFLQERLDPVLLMP